MKKRFPIFATILLTIAVIWLLNDLEVFTIDLPWIPIILIIVAIGMISNRYNQKNDAPPRLKSSGL